ncbi:MAG TPA: hypothetical protein ENI85_08140 [Deltaproteobacteria bacterium]|nr:hypothetical protein [Deltaproteobacteria bacterium]
MASMLAESLSSATSLAWLVFSAGILWMALMVPTLAWILRRRLPSERLRSFPAGDASGSDSRNGRIALDPVRFGNSPRARRSPRHAVQQHRMLLAGVFSTLLALVALPGLVALRSLGPSALQKGMIFVLPTLLVVLHARRRAMTR